MACSAGSAGSATAWLHFTGKRSTTVRTSELSLGQGNKVGALDEVCSEFSGCAGRLSRPPGQHNVALGFGWSIGSPVLIAS